MHTRRRKARSHEAVSINLTAMLDMAFQLLAFFVLTFRPGDIESQISLFMPPPRPVTKQVNADDPGDVVQPNPGIGFQSLVVSMMPSDDGRLGNLMLADAPVGNLASLERKLAAALGDAALPFEQVIIQVGSGVRYDALMSVVDVCTRQKLRDGKRLTKLSFVELPGV